MQQLTPQNFIRTETALSKFPIHRLAKKGNVLIEIADTKPNGEIRTKWEVSYNGKYGQPGPLAYKLDTLVINRRIEEAGKPVPKILKLGSLRDICEELKITEGKNTVSVKAALRQNAFAAISAKITYTATDKTERTLEADFYRYSVIFTGEKFPDGTRADAVYLVLNDIYMQIINSAQNRPLDYDYLKELAPAPQRFYEIISYQMFAAIKYNHPHAKLAYSDFCTYSTQTRYFDWEHVRKQMHKVHAPHLKSGYLAKIQFQEKRGDAGELDWIMLYVPGRRAKAEFRAATIKPRKIEQHKLSPVTLSQQATGEKEYPSGSPINEVAPEHDPLVTKLMRFHIAEVIAKELVRDYRRAVELQLCALPYRNLNKIRDLASWLIVAIKENHQLPETISEALAKEEEVKRARAKKEAAEVRLRDEEALRTAYLGYLRVRAAETERMQPEAYKAFLDNRAAERAKLEANPTHRGAAKKIYLRLFDDEQSHLEGFRDYFSENSFEEWSSKLR